MGSRVPPLPLLFAAIAVLLLLAHSDEIRGRAEEALGRGMPPREAALARGFVLGEDEGIDAATKEDFRRSGLAHLLAVSGQNVTLLGLLALPLLAALGLSLRARVLWLLALIAAYVPLAGAGPSICRAAIMGALGLLATLAGRRASRLYGLALAALVLLAIDPDIGADVGWQLSFAAVLGILLLAPPLRGAFVPRVGARGLRAALADGAGVTIAATLATAPLIAFHFGAVSTTTLFANLLALPVVAPAMWLGMLAAAAGQVPGLPPEPLNAVDAALLAYVAQVAAWCARPDWAYVEVRLGPGGLLASYAALAAVAFAIRRLGPTRRRVPLALATTLAALLVGWSLLAPRDGAVAGPVAGLRVSVLDVGQGDAILLQPRGGPAVLVDAGPAAGGLTDELREAGVAQLGAVVATHDQADHVGGLPELLGALPVGRVLYAALGRRTLAELRAAAVPAEPLARGRRDPLWRAENRGPLAAGRAARRAVRRGRPERPLAGPARPLAPLLDAARGRRRGRVGAVRPRPCRRAQGRAPRQ